MRRFRASRRAVACVATVLLAGCSTTYEVRTKPEGAKIYSGAKEIAATPAEFSASDIEPSAGGALVRIEAEGHQRLWVWLPDDGNHYDVTFNLTPLFRRAQDEKTVGDIDIDRIDLYRLSDRLLAIQQALLLGQTATADELKPLVEANPTMGSMLFLESLRLLREGKTDEGKAALRAALRFSPKEYDFLALMNELGGDGSKDAGQGETATSGKPAP